MGRTAADGLEWTGVRNRKTRTPRKDVGNESKLCFSNLLLLMVAPPGQNQRVAHSHQLPRVSRPSEQNVDDGNGKLCRVGAKVSLAAQKRAHLQLGLTCVSYVPLCGSVKRSLVAQAVCSHHVLWAGLLFVDDVLRCGSSLAVHTNCVLRYEIFFCTCALA